jgi:RNA polymerase sigma-70 factor (ECF subfamily)
VESEAELIARCRGGEEEAWGALFDLHYATAARFIFQLSPAISAEDAEEICQEAFVSVIRHLSGFDSRSSFQTWLFRIAINKSRDFLAKANAAKRGRGQKAISLDAEDPATGLKIDAPSRAPSPDGALMNAEQMDSLRRALDQLGDPCREIIELKYFGDLSYGEIASALALNPKTVSSRLSKCLDKLEVLARPLFALEKVAAHAV